MANKDQFTQDEWYSVLGGPASAGTYVMAVSPSGLTGLLAEMQGIVTGLLELSQASPNPFIQEIAQSLKPNPDEPAPEQQKESFKNLDEARERLVNRVRQAVFLVDSKVNPEDAKAYKALVMGVALRVANAATEGGFLGVGGTRVSDKEQAALEELRGLLGM
jgi:hypothetical protein